MKFCKDRKCYKYNLFFFKNLVKPFQLILVANLPNKTYIHILFSYFKEMSVKRFVWSNFETRKNEDGQQSHNKKSSAI